MKNNGVSNFSKIPNAQLKIIIQDIGGRGGAIYPIRSALCSLRLQHILYSFPRTQPVHSSPDSNKLCRMMSRQSNCLTCGLQIVPESNPFISMYGPSSHDSLIVNAIQPAQYPWSSPQTRNSFLSDTYPATLQWIVPPQYPREWIPRRKYLPHESFPSCHFWPFANHLHSMSHGHEPSVNVLLCLYPLGFECPSQILSFCPSFCSLSP